MVDATFDGVSDAGCQGCVDLWEVCGGDLYGTSCHFVGEGFPGVRSVVLSAVGCLENEVVGRKSFQVDDATDDGEVPLDLGFQECCYGGGEDVFWAFSGGVLVDLGFVGMDNALVFSGDGFSEGASCGFLCLCLRHGAMVGRGRGKA